MNELLVIITIIVAFGVGCYAGMEKWRKNADTNETIVYRGMAYKVYYRVKNKDGS